MGIRVADSAGNCYNVEVRSSSPGSNYDLDAFVDGQPVFGVARVDSVQVRRYSNRVRVSVPNCELVDLVMWVMVVEMRGENMIKFVIMRGVNLSPTSHGLVGKIMFTSIPHILACSVCLSYVSTGTHSLVSAGLPQIKGDVAVL